MRKKNVEFDGASFTIGALTFQQVEDYTADQPSGERNEIIIKNADLICLGLNNALPADAPAEAKWTPERCKKELDPVLFWRLLPEEIMKFSGLTPKLPDAKPKPGEVPAASGK
jgi:hypothetical protein